MEQERSFFMTIVPCLFLNSVCDSLCLYYDERRKWKKKKNTQKEKDFDGVNKKQT